MEIIELIIALVVIYYVLKLLFYLTYYFFKYIVIPLSILTGFICAIISIFKFIKAFMNNIDIRDSEKNPNDNEPAKLNYFFGPIYKQVNASVSEGVKSSISVVTGVIHFINETVNDWDLGIVIDKIIAWLCIIIIGAIGYTFLGGMAIFLSLTIYAFAAIVTVVFAVFFFIIYIMDQAYLTRYRIKSDCEECKQTFRIPAFECPSCGKLHYKLYPNNYGVFYHRCDCGRKLPSTFFTGRSKLNAYCPNCGSSLVSSDTRSIIIQLCGSSSCGKTVYLASFLHEYLNNLNKNINVNYTIPEDKNYDFQNVKSIFQGYLPDSTVETNSKMYPVIVEGTNIKPKRKFTLYDIAGEMFDGYTNQSEIIQAQMKYCNGLVLLIDPFFNEILRNESENNGQIVEKYTTMDANDLVNNFINYLLTINAIKMRGKTKIPLAVVVNKADYRIIKSQIGKAKINAEYRKAKSLDEDLDYQSFNNEMIKNFLSKYDMSNAVEELENHFSNINYYCVSAMGHIQDGEEFEPEGVLDPIEWIVALTDNSYYNATK